MINKKGNTLVEVIVSFVIISIVVGALSSVFISSKKINLKTTCRKNIVSEVDNIMTLFTGDATNILDTISRKYCVVSQEDKVTIYYDSKFIHSLDETDNYLEITLIQNEDLYTLEIQVFLKNELIKLAGEDLISRSILVKG